MKRSGTKSGGKRKVAAGKTESGKSSTAPEPTTPPSAAGAPAGSDAPPAPPAPTRVSAPSAGSAREAVAHRLASQQREISVSEFFAKNRHLLGFDNPRKALLTAVKEAVDNSLDACEEARVLPDLLVVIKEIAEDRFRMIVEDNGPGIVKAQIPKVFGKLLYGSKFHTLKMSRGQQGIGISAAGLYGQLTTGSPVTITSRISPNKPAHYFVIHIDTVKNQPDVLKDEEVAWDKPHGTRVEIEMTGKYQKGARSIDEYLYATAIANPHAEITYHAPDGAQSVYRRAVNELPPLPKVIQPHPYGVELGVLQRLLKTTKARNIRSFFTSEFCRVSPRIADEILTLAMVKPNSRPANVGRAESERIHAAIPKVKIIAPPSDCVIPIGEEQIIQGLRMVVPEAVFYTAVTRSPAVYRGHPFLCEAGIAYGGKLPPEDLVGLYRLANRVPLLYQQSACGITQAVLDTSWKNYGLQQSRGALPAGPAVLMVHMASVWVPFTSESKEAIADYPEIEKEIRLVLQECGRRLSTFIRKREHAAYAAKRASQFELYSGLLAWSLKTLTGKPEKTIQESILTIAKRDLAKNPVPEPPKLEEVKGLVVEHTPAPGSESAAGAAAAAPAGTTATAGPNAAASPPAAAGSSTRPESPAKSRGKRPPSPAKSESAAAPPSTRKPAPRKR